MLFCRVRSASRSTLARPAPPAVRRRDQLPECLLATGGGCVRLIGGCGGRRNFTPTSAASINAGYLPGQAPPAPMEKLGRNAPAKPFTTGPTRRSAGSTVKRGSNPRLVFLGD